MSQLYSLITLLQLVGVLPIVAIASGLRHQSPDICKLIDSQIPGRISYPGSEVYDASVASYYSGQERELTPHCIFRPTTTSEVSEFVKSINTNSRKHARHRTDSRFSQPQFAIRGGGHTLWPGAANIDNGVTVDLREMKSVVLSEDQKMASVGGGAVFSDIYPQLVPYNRTVMGGRVPGIAVGGFTTGGGLNFLSRRHGFSCDNIYGYEVVLASGEVIYASASSHKDLWLALKGGSNNFGIVTRFDLAAFPQGEMWGGAILFDYTKSNLEAQANAFSNFMDPQNFDSAADMGVILGYLNSGESEIYTLGNSLFYMDGVPNPPVFQPFTSIPSLEPNTLALGSVSETVDRFGEFLPPHIPRGIELVYSHENSDASLFTELFQIWEDGTKEFADIEDLQIQFLVQPQAVTNGTNSFGLEPGRKDIVISVLTAAYANAADDDIVEERLHAIVDKHVAILEREGLYIPYKYLNYADKSQDPIGSYGKVNKRRLQAVSKKYDPHGLFQTGVPGGFKLF
ncbi:hypothetical protein AJ80_03306 [Polytolypa hystricis UAMH7299]|uniref:FAD-binding PCMH-type domain-containing protein n=1 Tax=Polytolypa hystricis (strain UAMH7299) TaxID=1447883 RepID=A0A2B7YK13_POLH7|nr:hypothetical protein AJ80_03306 [Polytolypa hystricis UAMH7299]